MIAVDTSALVKYLLKKKTGVKLEGILEEGGITISFTYKEDANTLWRRVVSNEISEDHVNRYKAT